MTILSSKHFKLFNHSMIKSKKSSFVTAAATAANSYISKLPKELLECIYNQLETLDCQYSFSHTCKSFHKIAIDTRSNASWVVTRFGPRFAIYYALLAYPLRCNHQFIQYLINFGARVPRYLVQVLIQVYGKHIKSSENRRRRSSFDTIDLDLFFLKAVQQLSFDGYATLIYQGFKSWGNIYNSSENDLNLFLTSLDRNTFNESIFKNLISHHQFFPAPLLLNTAATTTNSTTLTINYRHVLKLAQISPKEYDLIAPVFDFDPLARSSLWEAILLLFFDEAFRSTEPTKERKIQFDSIRNTVITHQGRHVQLAGPLTDQQIFCQVFATFFTKYPVGYCHQQTMSKFLFLLKTYVEPNFNIDVALKHMVLSNIGRRDTIESVDEFLKNSQSNSM